MTKVPEKVIFDFIPNGLPVVEPDFLVIVIVALPAIDNSPAFTAVRVAKDPHNAVRLIFDNLFII